MIIKEFDKNPLVLSFDVGTQSVRAVLTDKKGLIEGSYKVQYKSPCIKSKVYGQAEQYPDFYYEKICEASLLLKKQVGQSTFDRIEGITITCIRDSILILDKEKKPLRNIIIWMDYRKATGKPNLPLWKKFFLKLVHMEETATMLYKDSFFNWIRENEPELWEKTDKFIMLPGYINFRLTGVLKDGVANQVGHIPFNNKKRCWLKRGLARFIADVPLENLINLAESGEIIGLITEETAARSGLAQGLPLFASGSDKACEALGLSVITKEKAAISLGTAASIQFCTDKYFEPEPFLPSYPSVIPGLYNSENQIYRGFWIVRWFIDNFCKKEKSIAKQRKCSVEEILDSYLNEISPGANGLIMTPHFAPGAGNPFAKATITGLSDRHNKKHLYRAIIEGIFFELYHAMKRMEKRSKQIIKVIYAGGGGSRSNCVLKIAANIFGLPVVRTQTNETSALGSSIAGFIGLGYFKTYKEAVSSMVHKSVVFKPVAKIHKIYLSIYDNIYSKIEKTNTPIFRKIKSN